MAARNVDQAVVEIESSLVMPFEVGELLVCAVCRAIIHAPDGSGDLCENCAENAIALDGGVTPVVPITLYERESTVRTWLTHYKPDIDGQHGEATASVEECAAAVSLILSRFFDANAWILDDVDQVLVVPSTRRLPPHPLETIVAETVAAELLVAGRLTRTSSPLDHRQPSVLAYQGGEALRSQRVLLIDDVYASGARLQSAAAAARRAGGTIAAAVVVARRINPGYHPTIGGRWAEALRQPFEWSRPH